MATAPQFDWYLKEWLLNLRGRAGGAWFEAETGYTHRIANQLINRKIRWNRDHLMLAAKTLQVYPWELLMHPDEANQIKRLRAAVDEEARLQLVADSRASFSAAPPEDEPLTPKRRVN